jgi:hypothetical protein
LTKAASPIAAQSALKFDSGGYSLVKLDEGGLLLETIRGELYALNRSATEIWEARLGGLTEPEISRALAARYDLRLDEAERDVSRAFNLVQIEQPPSSADFEYGFERGHYVLSYKGEAAFEISASGATIAGRELVRRRPELIPDMLEAALPKALALRGHLILHAAAVSTSEGVLVFVGPSGAGKTTTAESLGTAGATPISEDKLFLSSGLQSAHAVLEGEKRLLGWIKETTPEIERGRGVECAPLDDLFRQPAAPLAHLCVLDSSRRSGTTTGLRALHAADALRAIFLNSFVGSSNPGAWIDQVKRIALAAKRVLVSELTVPDGLDNLRKSAGALLAALRRSPQIGKTAS